VDAGRAVVDVCALVCGQEEAMTPTWMDIAMGLMTALLLALAFVISRGGPWDE